MNKDLTIQTGIIEGHYLVTLSGTIGSASAEDLDQELQKAAEQRQYSIIIDLDKVNLITSSGLRVLLKAAKQCRQHRGSVKLVHVPDSLREIFRIIGISFNIFNDIEAALVT